MAGLLFGWEEWAALPSLGLPAMPAKIDTGARTSVLHAVQIEVFGSSSDLQVRFAVPATPGFNGPPLSCEAPLADRRRITASNGRAEVRPIVRTLLGVGEDVRTVDISLTDRALMTYRMLLGREALAAFGALVDPSRKRLRPRTGDAAGRWPEAGGSVSGPDGLR
jgi:ribosomal protein S6--L-glutamate ligase